MRYSILYFIFTFLGLNILVYGGYNQQQVQDTYTQQQPYQQQQTDPYNNLGGPYNDLSSLSNQIIQNGNTINNEQTQNLQQAPNVTQQVWDPSQDQRQFDRSYLQSPYGAPMHAYGPPMYQQGPGPLGPGWKLPPDPKNNPHLPKPPNDSDESKVKNKDSNPNDYNDLTKEVNEWKNKQKDWQQTTMKWALGLGLGTGIPAILLILVCAFCLIRRYRRRKQQHIEGNYNARSPIITNTTKYMNSYTGSWEVPPIVHDDLWAMERDNVVIDYEKKLGAGAFCNVYQGRIIGDAPIKKVYHNLIAVNHFTNCDVAIKILPSFADDIARSDFNQEINFMKSLNYHPHLVSMLGYVADARSPLLIVEYCSQGDLLHLIRERKYEIANGYENQSGLKIKDLVSFSWQISNGLEYLNSLGCIHRDVAARNVLVNQGNICKIGDFGLCRLTDNLLYTARGGRLPLRWMAPESLKSFEYSFKSDVWSYGIVLYELFSLGEVPYSTIENRHLLDFLENGERLSKPLYCSEEIYQVMLKCWHLQSEERLSFREICQIFIRILEDATIEYGYVQPIPDEPVQQVDDV